MAAPPTFKNITGASTTILVPAVVGESAGLSWFLLTNDSTAAGTFTFQDTGGNALSAAHAVPANGVIGLPNLGGMKFQTPLGTGLQIVNSAGNMQISYGPLYYP